MRSNKEKALLVIAVAFIIIAALIYYYNNIKIPQIKELVENRVRMEIDVTAMPTKKVLVVKSEKGLAKNTKISLEIIEEHFEVLEIPIKFVARNTTGDIEALLGKVSTQNLSYGQQLIADFFIEHERKYGDSHRLKEYSVFNLVDGNVKAGNLVDIIVDYQNGDYDIVVSKIKIESISNRVIDEQESKGYVIVMAVDEVQFRDLSLAEKIGVLKTRLYIDDEQKASDVTFDHIVAMEKLLIEKDNLLKTTKNAREAVSRDGISQASDEE
ncbi:MAG: hypothetical protein LRZ93_03540 [Clostridiales bacterium]|nr:hypothetical protein [Clostridiales bacterium]